MLNSGAHDLFFLFSLFICFSSPSQAHRVKEKMIKTNRLRGPTIPYPTGCIQNCILMKGRGEACFSLFVIHRLAHNFSSGWALLFSFYPSLPIRKITSLFMRLGKPPPPQKPASSVPLHRLTFRAPSLHDGTCSICQTPLDVGAPARGFWLKKSHPSKSRAALPPQQVLPSRRSIRFLV